MSNRACSEGEVWRISADTGGTFTDVVARSPDGRFLETKVLSSGVLRLRILERISSLIVRVDGNALTDGFLIGLEVSGMGMVVRHADGLLEFSDGMVPNELFLSLPTSLPAPLLGAHLVTGTPLSASLPPCLLRVATTRGTNALLERKGAAVELYMTKGFEDLLAIGDQTRPDLFALRVENRPLLYRNVRGVDLRFDRDGNLRGTGVESQETDRSGEEVDPQDSVAVVSFCNGFRSPSQEKKFADGLLRKGWSKVVTASDVARMPGYLRRTETAVVEAYLTPVLDRYLGELHAEAGVRRLDVMNSAGGMVPSGEFKAIDSLLSGPAGGVAGAAVAGAEAGVDRFLAFDMGGTSTDVSRYDGKPIYRSELSVGSARIFSDALRIDTVAAGGGSVCGFDGFAFTVGPDSAGADPGPACYGCGGPLTLTDVHVLLGRIDAGRFRVPINPDLAGSAFDSLLSKAGLDRSGEEERTKILKGFLSIANERMAAALRGISLRDGKDPAEYDLLSFGGAGGLHACGLAERLGIKRILQPAGAGILSAKGLDGAQPESMIKRPILLPLNHFEKDAVEVFESLAEEARAKLHESPEIGELSVIRNAFVRVSGQETSLLCEWRQGVSLREVFLGEFEKIFGFQPLNPVLEVESAQVRVRAKSGIKQQESFPMIERGQTDPSGVLNNESLHAGVFGEGSCVIAQEFGTLFVEPGWRFRVGDRQSILVERVDLPQPLVEDEKSQPVQVEHELFRRRFGGVVEAMGGQLERTALSVNIRERLDFSCALLDRKGDLVVNAPHIPVHLGAMGTCIRSVSKQLDWRPGDIAATNHPAFGGSHLPDLTVVAPVFDGGALQCFVAVRAHHAEIGGVRPGSMPPDAKCLSDEGVVIKPMYLFREGVNRMDDLAALLKAEKGGSLPSRDPSTNLADVLSQVAAVREGVRLTKGLLSKYGPDRIDFFFRRILSQSEEMALDAIMQRADKVSGKQLTEKLDGGGEIQVRAEGKDKGALILDFQGSSTGTGSFQCPEGVSLSAILYVVRLLVDRDIPLNEGLLRAVKCRIPHGSLLSADFSNPDPRFQPPVVAGNVEVSQRLVSLLIRLFDLGAGSQATMNNVAFGGKGFSHYETLGGGSGATGAGSGGSAVQVHMTNTAITDPEILEHRFPVRLERFAIRKASGGAGINDGGDGTIREYLFERETEISLLTQQRSAGPEGARGGADGLPGRQTVVYPDGRKKILPFASTVKVPEGTRLIVESPGGGGWGDPDG